MSSRAWQFRVRDIINAVNSIEQRTARMTYEEFAANETVVKSVLYDFIVIGEASRNIPAQIQSRYAQIPWRLSSDMRAYRSSRIFSGKFNANLENYPE